MFKIVFLIYIAVSGAPMEAPTSLDLKPSFAGLEKCQEYLASQAFANDRSRLSQRISAAVTFLESAKAEKSGGVPPVMDTAITASCEMDDRI